MAKNYNPADAFRGSILLLSQARDGTSADPIGKAQRAKELKKNKETRKKVRDVQTVKRDTRGESRLISFLPSHMETG